MNLNLPFLDKSNDVSPIESNTKTKQNSHSIETFIDLFAGIGGFHVAMRALNLECVFASEWDKEARKTYEINHIQHSKKMFDMGRFAGDITEINPKNIPDFDLLCAGFPCQPFSQAGFKKGFDEVRGTLFFNIVNIINIKQPKVFFLENVRHLLMHNDGKTFKSIQNVIENELGYSFYYKVIKASDFGLPQHRPRLFMVGFRDKNIDFTFPDSLPLKMSMSDIFGAQCDKKIGFTLRVGGRGSGLYDRRNWDTYLVNGTEKRLGVNEGKKMMGLPKDFIFPVSETQAMKQLGNGVAVPAIQATAQKIIETFKKYG